MNDVLVITSEKLGQGDDELGHILMRGFLTTIGQRESVPEKIILMNSAVKLACEGSPLLGELRSIEARGATVSSCATCLGFYNLREALAVGEPGTMLAAVDELMAFNGTTVI